MRVFFIICLMLFFEYTDAQSFYIPAEPIKIDFNHLKATKAALEKGDLTISQAYSALIKKANQLLTLTPKSVMDKKEASISGNKHDYVSLAPYWWPDSSKQSGLPYIKKDGLINPEVKLYQDKENMPKMCEYVYVLGLAYFLSNDEQYASKATQLVHTWFLDTATKMNPNLNYAQIVKGINNGRGTGIIDTRHFIYAIDGIQLIQTSTSWTKEQDRKLKEWFSTYLHWMLSSENGKDERQTKNNHGVWFDAQALSIAIYVDSIELAKKIIESAMTRLDQQSNKDGLFPLELERTNSLHYSCFNLLAFSVIAQLADDIHIDFWHAYTKEHHSLQQSYDALIPFLINSKKWQYPQIAEFHSEESFVLLYLANKQWKQNSVADYLQQKSQQYKGVFMTLL